VNTIAFMDVMMQYLLGFVIIISACNTRIPSGIWYCSFICTCRWEAGLAIWWWNTSIGILSQMYLLYWNVLELLWTSVSIFWLIDWLIYLLHIADMKTCYEIQC